MNPYYANWSYGYTLHPSSDASRGAYQVQYGAHQSPANWSQIKGGHPLPPAPPKAQVFVTAAPSTVKTEAVSSSGDMAPPSTFSAPPTVNQTPEDPAPMALLKLHELAIANKLVERYEKVEEKTPPPPGNSAGSYKIVLFLGNEIYQGSGITIKVAKQQAAVQALQNTKYQSKEEQKAAIPTLPAKKIGVTATSELYEWATKKGVFVDFKFLEPFNFEFKHSMRMWDKKEMLGNYRVQLNVAGYEFYGQAELPQQAKHNAAVQALPIVRNLPDPTGSAAVVSQPAVSTEGDAIPGSSASCGSGAAGLEKNVNMALNEIAMQNGCVPEWTLISESGPQHQKRFTWQLTMGQYTTTGTGHSKKIAKASAAEQMMSTLPEDWKSKAGRARKKVGVFNGKKRSGAPLQSPPAKKKQQDGSEGKIVITADNPVSCLYEFAKKKKIPDPDFDCIAENLLETWQRGNQTMKKIAYTMQLKIDGKTYHAESNTKKAAKQACAAEAWNSIRATLL